MYSSRYYINDYDKFQIVNGCKIHQILLSMSLVLATGSYDYTIKFWDPSTSGSTNQIEYGTSPKQIINKLDISVDKAKLVAGFSCSVKIYDIDKWNVPPKSYDNPNQAVINYTGVGFQKDSKWIFTSQEDGTIKIYDLKTKEEVRTFKNQAPINSAILHPNQIQIIFGDENGALKIFDLSANKIKSEAPTTKNQVGIRSVCIASNAKYLLSCDSAGIVYPYYLQNSEHLLPSKPFLAHDDYILKVQIANDNCHMATCSADKKIKIWELRQSAADTEVQFQEKHCLKGHSKWVWDCDFSCDSAYLISASSDALVKLWDVQSGEMVQTLKGHLKGITCLALNDFQ